MVLIWHQISFCDIRYAYVLQRYTRGLKEDDMKKIGLDSSNRALMIIVTEANWQKFKSEVTHGMVSISIY